MTDHSPLKWTTSLKRLENAVIYGRRFRDLDITADLERVNKAVGDDAVNDAFISTDVLVDERDVKLRQVDYCRAELNPQWDA